METSLSKHKPLSWGSVGVMTKQWEESDVLCTTLSFQENGRIHDRSCWTNNSSSERTYIILELKICKNKIKSIKEKNRVE